ncbi:MAG TPA: Eco57I restriction-modification methylase domain-containing protein, partial [Candidatus Sumerlaeota bacterium]|nr:Eco57I restriction-modification methylase domain-containing protein [Candidatus Sumerlaeota bacterium]
MKKTGRASTPADESLRDRTDIQDTLLALGHDGGLDPLKSIFWSLLNYNKSNKPLSRRNWTDSRKSALKEDPLLLATGGVDEAFHIIYARLASDALKLSLERPVIESLLNEHPYSLFVFSNEAQNRWHFVNVKIASGDEDENRDHKRRRLFRRITIGPDERLRTATDRVNFLDLAQFQTDLFGISPLAIQKQHDEAFDVEAVTRSFYNDYRQVFDALQNDLASQSGDPVWAHDYSLQFLNRCMFIYFIQRKRWLANDRDFFLNFWKSYQKSSHKPDTFFELWMKALFFQAFNNGTIEDNASMPPHILEALRNAPYLNGGLFAQNELDTLFNRRHAVIIDERFKKTIEFLEAYNFTVSEDTPLDQEVAVDAEMLGKVYESLVNVSADTDERGDAGIFYTPRTEIDLMCRLSLVDNLTNHLGPQYKNLLYETIFTFTHEDQQSADSKLLKAGLWDKIDRHLRQITVIDPACGSGSFLVGMLQVIDGLQERANAALGTQESAYSRRRRIIGQSLYGVDVKPWAVDIAELRLWLQLVIESDLNARELKATPLLPNLSFKIRRGDSLMQEIGGMNTSRHGGYSQIPDKSTQAKIEKLKKAKLDFYNNKGSSSRNDLNMEELLVFHELLESRENYLIRKKTALSRPKVEDMFQHPKTQMSDQEKDTLEQQLAELRRTRNALKNVKDVPFVWNIAFVEIFEGEKNGFDIVIGNPPYVRQEQISNPLVSRDQVTTENKKDYKNRLIHSVYMLYPEFFGNPNQPSHKLNAKSDLYIYFYFHGLSLLNPKGSFCFITSNSWLDVGYGADLQEFLLTQGHVKMIMDNQAKRSFAQADVNTIIALLSPPAAKDENGVKKEEMA